MALAAAWIMPTPVAIISTSSAKMYTMTPAPMVPIRPIHGLMINATMVMEKGQPWGIPHFRLYGAPNPPASALYTTMFSR